MMVLVSYDVQTVDEGGPARLRKVARECQKVGQRVQDSVFECLVDPAQFEELRGKLVRIIDDEVDSLRFYFLGKNWRSKVVHIGAKPSLDLEGPLFS
jgi:CRISPR-associated protein Cas2